MSDSVDYYKILGVSKLASNSEIRNRYQYLAKKYHPDLDGDDSIMKLINKAYSVLSDPRKKFEYDKKPSYTTDHQHAHHQQKKEQVKDDDFDFWGDSKERINNNKSRNKKPILIIAGSVFGALVILLIIGSIANNNKAANNSQLNIVHQNEIKLRDTHNQFVSLPTTTTKLKVDWDNYYNDYISQFQTILDNTKGSYNDPLVSTLNDDIKTTSQDELSIVNLNLSTNDMHYQIDSDKTSLQNAKDSLKTTIADNASICGYGAVVCYGVSSATDQSLVDSNQAQLENDQKTYNEQQSQTDDLIKKISNDWKLIDKDLSALSLN